MKSESLRFLDGKRQRFWSLPRYTEFSVFKVRPVRAHMRKGEGESRKDNETCLSLCTGCGRRNGPLPVKALYGLGETERQREKKKDVKWSCHRTRGCVRLHKCRTCANRPDVVRPQSSLVRRVQVPEIPKTSSEQHRVFTDVTRPILANFGWDFCPVAYVRGIVYSRGRSNDSCFSPSFESFIMISLHIMTQLKPEPTQAQGLTCVGLVPMTLYTTIFLLFSAKYGSGLKVYADIIRFLQ